MSTAFAVFVPSIGFAPRGTRMLARSAVARSGDTSLRVRAVAASPERTTVLIEWQTIYEREACPPLVSALMEHQPLEESFAAELSIDGKPTRATAMIRQGCSLGWTPSPPPREMARATHLLTFTGVPTGTTRIDLHVREGTNAWRIPIDLQDALAVASPLSASDEHDGVRMSLNAVARDGSALAFALEVITPLTIRAVGAPVPVPLSFSDDDEQTRQERTVEMRRVFGSHAEPIRLEEKGERLDETRREMPPGWRDDVMSTPSTYRCAVVFEDASHITAGTFVVPYVDLMDLTPSVDVDLRNAPLDLELGERRFRVAAVERHGDESRLVFDLPPAEGSARFMGPARVASGVSTEFSFHGPVESDQPWMAIRAGEPPIVTLRGVVLRVDGPWRLRFTRSS